jgi:Tn3 transposase DDE domain
MLALHICLFYINTLVIQRVLGEPDWAQRMLPDDLRALTPLIYAHVTPYDSPTGPFGSGHEQAAGH